MDLSLTFGILFFLGILYLLLGVIVFILKPDTTVSWVFFAACFLQGVSSLVSFDLETTHIGFVRAYLFDEAFLPAVVLHLSLLFPEKYKFIERYPRTSDYSIPNSCNPGYTVGNFLSPPLF